MVSISILDLIGSTPMVELTSLEKKYSLSSRLFVKLENFNPTSSIKVRVAKFLLDQAFKDNLINHETIIIEPTSGNTGVGLSFICALYKLRFIAIMPDNMSLERQKLIKAYGGEIILTPSKDGLQGSINKAKELHKKYTNSYIPFQFENKNNSLIHYLTTGKEIYLQTNKEIDVFVSVIGTGGTISGVSKYLKERKDVLTIGIEPSSSPLISKGYFSSHKIPGIGPNFISPILELDYVDKIETVSNEDAYKYCKKLAKEEGLFGGISTGANLCIALKYASLLKNKNIVFILMDTGERYLSLDLIE